jgi:hypothetical protein
MRPTRTDMHKANGATTHGGPTASRVRVAALEHPIRAGDTQFYPAAFSRTQSPAVDPTKSHRVSCPPFGRQPDKDILLILLNPHTCCSCRSCRLTSDSRLVSCLFDHPAQPGTGSWGSKFRNRYTFSYNVGPIVCDSGDIDHHTHLTRNRETAAPRRKALKVLIRPLKGDYRVTQQAVTCQLRRCVSPRRQHGVVLGCELHSCKPCYAAFVIL